MTLPSLAQGWDDMQLSPTAQRVLWIMHKRLDVVEWRPVKVESLARECRIKPTTCSDALHALLKRGYLDMRRTRGAGKEYRLFVSRRPSIVQPESHELPLFPVAA